jgi:O-antigen/teichoic acid export membrane protein
MIYLKKIVASQAVLVLFDQAIYSGTNFLLTFFLAQQLEVKSFGLFSTILLITYLIMSIVNALLIQPFQVSISKTLKKEEYYLSIFLGLVALLFFFMFVVKLLSLFSPVGIVFKSHSNAIICFIMGYIFQDFFRKLFLSIANISTVLVIDSLFLTIILLGFHFSSNQVNLTIALWIIGLANFVSAIPGLLFILKNYEKPLSWKIFLKDHISQGKWLLSVAVLQWSSSNFFVLVSGLYLGIEALGALRLVQSLFGIINIILQSVENFFLPKVAALYHKSTAKAKAYLLEISLYGALLFGVMLSVLFFFSTEIIILAGGEKYRTYGYVVKIIAVLYFFIFLSYPIRIAIRIMVLNKIFFFGYLFSFLFSMLTFHFLLKYAGLYGAVSGLICNQIIMMLYWQTQLKKNHFYLWK